jgi:phage gpG-like protein
MTWELTGSADAFEVEGLLAAGARQAGDTGIVMAKIVNDMLRVEKQIFYGQGRRGGGSWQQLAPDTVRKKGVGYQNILRTASAKPGYSKIGDVNSVDTLFRSLTEPGAPYQLLNVTNTTVEFGTDRPYAGAHQYGSWLRFIPARPFLNFLQLDIDRWDAMIGGHLMAPFMAGNPEETGK